MGTTPYLHIKTGHEALSVSKPVGPLRDRFSLKNTPSGRGCVLAVLERLQIEDKLRACGK